mmetsp:Transcript_14590/g.63196  ORF Transcript_14590/g.63196 Transcript_14590/m.63196 type:complete len:303 (+) Transcript_14590:1474-2382(+)
MPPRATAASLDDFFLANVDFWKNSLGFAAGFAAPAAAPAPGLDAFAVGSFRYAATPRTLTPPKDVIDEVVAGREMVVTVLAIVVVATPAPPGGLGTPTRVAAGTAFAAGLGPGGFEPSTFGTRSAEPAGLAVAGFASSAPRAGVATATVATPGSPPTFRRFDASLSSVRAAAFGRFAAEAAAAAAGSSRLWDLRDPWDLRDRWDLRDPCHPEDQSRDPRNFRNPPAGCSPPRARRRTDRRMDRPNRRRRIHHPTMTQTGRSRRLRRIATRASPPWFRRSRSRCTDFRPTRTPCWRTSWRSGT